MNFALQSASGLAFNSPGGVFFENGTLNLGAAGIKLNSVAGGVIFSITNQSVSAANITLTSSQTWTNNSTSKLGANALALGANTLTIDGSGDTSLGGPFQGSISGSGRIVMNGTGALTISNANSFSGGTTLNSGTLQLQGPTNPLGSGPLTINGGAVSTFILPVTLGAVSLAATPIITVASSPLTISGPITGSGGLTKAGPGSLTLSGANTSTGDIMINEGTLTQTNDLAANLINSASFVYSGGAFAGQLNNHATGSATFNADFTAGNGITNFGSMSMNKKFTANGSGLDNEGIISLNGGMIDGAGPQANNSQMSGFGTIAGSGGFTNSASLSLTGDVLLSNGGANSNTGNIEIPSSPTLSHLQLTGGALANSGTIQFDGGFITGTSSLNNNAAGIVTGQGTISSPFSNAGLVTVPANTITISSPFTNGGHIQVAGTSAVVAGGTITNSNLIDGFGTVANDISNTDTIQAVGGTLTLTGSVTNLAAGRINAPMGTKVLITAATPANAGSISFTRGIFEFSKAVTNAPGGTIADRGTLIVGGAGLTNNGNLAISGGQTDVFGKVNNQTGVATKGVTIFGNSDTFFWDDVANSAGSQFNVAAGSSATFFGSYSGDGITGGGQIFFEAAINPGFSPAAVSFGGDVFLDPGAQLNIELGGASAGTGFDHIAVAGNISVGGILAITLINGFTPAAGNTFDILDCGHLSGSFSSLALPALAAGLKWNTSHLYTSGVLGVQITGDYNGNGVVDAADYTVWRDSLGWTTNLAADGNGNGVIDSGDYSVWKANYGNHSGAGAGANSGVPEPATLALAMIATALLCARPRAANKSDC